MADVATAEDTAGSLAGLAVVTRTHRRQAGDQLGRELKYALMDDAPEVSGPPLRECQVCGAFAALEFCAACGCAQEEEYVE